MRKVFLIIDLPKYHFLHQTEDNSSFGYFDVLVSDILWLKFFQKYKIWIWNGFKFFTLLEISQK